MKGFKINTLDMKNDSKSLMGALVIIMGATLFLLSNSELKANELKISKSPGISNDLFKSKNWSDLEKKNVQVISSFVQDLMIDHKTDEVLSKYGNSSYIQHNRNIPDGMEGITNYIKEFTKEYPEFTYDVKRVVADGDMVIFHSHATLKKEHRGNDKKGLNITDIWRLEDGKIVEHWDSIQAIDVSMRIFSLLNGGKIENSNGVF